MLIQNTFKNKYRISSARLQTWDYGSSAAYFITICIKNKIHFFGEIFENKMQLNEMGHIAEKYWTEIPKHFLCVELDQFVIMPNHVHGIIIIDKPENNLDKLVIHEKDTRQCQEETRQCLVSTDNTGNGMGKLRFQNQGKNTISSIVGSYKSIVTKNINILIKCREKALPCLPVVLPCLHAGMPCQFGWQPRFY
ncbi:MAG TPA: hypothetical protein VK590_00875, partial [Saprospiraceae bacterium]|nr:hypothetical protein [Saprospiraceae bacterium]